jgi:hypothetical protein
VLDLSSENYYPIIKTISATGNLTQIRLPNRARRFTVGSNTGHIWLQTNGTDGQAPGAHKLFIVNNGYMQLFMGRGKDRNMDMYVAMQNGTGTITIIVEDE